MKRNNWTKKWHKNIKLNIKINKTSVKLYSFSIFLYYKKKTLIIYPFVKNKLQNSSKFHIDEECRLKLNIFYKYFLRIFLQQVFYFSSHSVIGYNTRCHISSLNRKKYFYVLNLSLMTFWMPAACISFQTIYHSIPSLIFPFQKFLCIRISWPLLWWRFTFPFHFQVDVFFWGMNWKNILRFLNFGLWTRLNNRVLLQMKLEIKEIKFLIRAIVNFLGFRTYKKRGRGHYKKSPVSVCLSVCHSRFTL